MSLVLKVKLHYSGMDTPQKAHASDAGLDLTLMEVVEKRAGIFFFDCGISIEPPAGYYTELLPRSSIYKHDFMMSNGLGIIDPDYRGRLFMPMRYLGRGNGLEEARALIGSRVGQLILRKLEPFEVQEVEEIKNTQRGEGGFGSSGR